MCVHAALYFNLPSIKNAVFGDFFTSETITIELFSGIDEKVENAKAEKVSDHFSGGCFKAEWPVGSEGRILERGDEKAEWPVGSEGRILERGVRRPNGFMVINAESLRGGVRRPNGP